MTSARLTDLCAEGASRPATCRSMPSFRTAQSNRCWCEVAMSAPFLTHIKVSDHAFLKRLPKDARRFISRSVFASVDVLRVICSSSTANHRSAGAQAPSKLIKKCSNFLCGSPSECMSGIFFSEAVTRPKNVTPFMIRIAHEASSSRPIMVIPPGCSRTDNVSGCRPCHTIRGFD